MGQVAEFYGVKVDRAGFANCPFHSEKTGSLKIYPDGYHCFGCGAHGDVISFVGGLYDLDFKGTCRKLNDDFVLGLPIDEKPDRNTRRKADEMARKRRKAREAQKKAVEAAKSAYDKALTLWVIFDTFVRKNAPKNPSDAFSDTWVTAVQMLGYLEWKLDQAEIALYEAEHQNPKF